MKNKAYKWSYSTKGFFLGIKMMILIDYKTLTPLFFHVYPANVHESKIYPLILEMLKRRGLIRFGDAVIIEAFTPTRTIRHKIRYCPFNNPKEEFQI